MSQDAFTFLCLSSKNKLPQKLTQCHVERQARQVKVSYVLSTNKIRKIIPTIATINSFWPIYNDNSMLTTARFMTEINH